MLDPERAAALGRRSGQARRKLTLGDVEVLHMDTPDDIRRGLELVQRWAVAGMLPGSVAGAAVRAGEVALRALDSQLDRERMKQLEGQVTALEAELAQRRGVRVMP